jgi:hypothetical protein
VHPPASHSPVASARPVTELGHDTHQGEDYPAAQLRKKPYNRNAERIRLCSYAEGCLAAVAFRAADKALIASRPHDGFEINTYPMLGTVGIQHAWCHATAFDAAACLLRLAPSEVSAM